MSSENLYWVWLSRQLGPANPDLPRLMMRFSLPSRIYDAKPADLAKINDISKQTIKSLLSRSLDEATQIIDFCAKSDVRILPYSDPDYPQLLRKISDPPTLLYVRGKLPQLDRRLCIAVVGTRKMTDYGRDNAFRISYDLAAAGAVVVSGLALGIDGVAAGGAISGGGKTVAVLGCGIDRVYPNDHHDLAQLVAQNGAVVTEYAPGTLPEATNFPVRNRIISGMCHGTLVVEADARSGALITAACANAQGRQVFAVPGDLGVMSTSGSNVLIRDGGLIVTDTNDILSEYPEMARTLDITRMKRARCEYSFSDATLARMGIYSRTVHAPGEKTHREPQGLIRPAVYNSREAEQAPPTSPSHPQQEPAAAGTSTTASATPTAAASTVSDRSAEVLASLSEEHRLIFSEMPDDRAVNTDRLTRLGFTVGEIMSFMTTLEIYGLVSSLPGGLYIKR